MSEVKTLTISGSPGNNGQYVRIEEYAVLKAERDALAGENVTLKSAIESHKHGFVRCECCGEDNLSSNDDVCRVLDETPATDAYLNSVRAAKDSGGENG